MKIKQSFIGLFLRYSSALIFLVVAIWITFDAQKWKKNEVLNYDVFGYHNYLPALFIYKDITQYRFIDSIESKYSPTQGNQKRYGLHPVPNSPNLCNQYPIGVSLFQVPFFMLAHVWAMYTGQGAADGYSSPYQHSIVLSTLLFAWLSLLVLVRFLGYYFDMLTVSITVLLLVFATNFLHYATLEAGLSHIYLFFLYSCILLLTRRWYEKATLFASLAIGFCIGLAILTRPLDILSCLIPLCWVNSNSSLSKSDYLKKNIHFIFSIAGMAFLVCLLQMSIWKYVTGQWIHYTYASNDYFQFNRFRVIHGLFSYRKGWFLYTPLALLAFIQAFKLKNHSKLSFYSPVFWIYFIPTIYLVFSWHNWFYGWSYSCRALLGAIPVLAIPLALLVKQILDSTLIKKVLYFIVIALLMSLNLFQAWQYEHYILHGSSMNEALYWQIFLKTERPPNYERTIQLQEELDWISGGW